MLPFNTLYKFHFHLLSSGVRHSSSFLFQSSPSFYRDASFSNFSLRSIVFYPPFLHPRQSILKNKGILWYA